MSEAASAMQVYGDAWVMLGNGGSISKLHHIYTQWIQSDAATDTDTDVRCRYRLRFSEKCQRPEIVAVLHVLHFVDL